MEEETVESNEDVDLVRRDPTDESDDKLEEESVKEEFEVEQEEVEEEVEEVDEDLRGWGEKGQIWNINDHNWRIIDSYGDEDEDNLEYSGKGDKGDRFSFLKIGDRSLFRKAATEESENLCDINEVDWKVEKR